MLEHTKTLTSFAVDDVARAHSFYTERLGLDVQRTSGVLFLRLHDGHHTLIYPKPDHVPATYTVLNFQVDDIDAAVGMLVDDGVRLLRFEALGAGEDGIVRTPERDIAWFTDPAGNIHSVFRSRSPVP